MALKRAPRSPSISLPDAILKIELIYNNEGKSSFDDIVAVNHMGYKGLNGASRRILGAVRGYGLMEGRGDLTITDDAITIIADKDMPDQSDRNDSLLRAIKHNSVFNDLYERFKNNSSTLNVSSYLQKTHGFKPASAMKAAQIYKDSIALVLSDKKDYYEDADNGSGKSSNLGYLDGVDDQLKDDPSNTKSDFGGSIFDFGFSSPSIRKEKPNMKQDIFNIDEGQIVLQFPESMSLESFEDFTDWLMLQQRKIGRKVDGKGKKPKLEIKD